MLYERRQKGSFFHIIFSILFLFLSLLLVKKEKKTEILFAMIVLLFAWFQFGSMKVEMDEVDLLVKFGPGFLHKRFSVSEIRSVKIVSVPWYHGWGMRYTFGGWLYRVSGDLAVEIEIWNGKKYRIGSDEPEVLHDIIHGQIEKNKV